MTSEIRGETPSAEGSVRTLWDRQVESGGYGMRYHCYIEGDTLHHVVSMRTPPLNEYVVIQVNKVPDA